MRIYLDYAAATPLDERVLAVMQPYFREAFYNPSSSYQAGREVRRAVEAARARVAHWLGAKPAEIIFTAGATESISIAIQGVMQRFPDAAVAVAATEHDAVRRSAERYNHAVIPVTKTGVIDLAELKRAVTNHTVLVSIAYANNEIGTIQPIKVIAGVLAEIRQARLRTGNALPLYFHTDASQAGGYLDLHASRLGVDLLTLNGGKIYGPKQSGMLFVKAGVRLEPLINGGGQESGLRSGTENVPGIIGFATALDLAQQERANAIAKQSVLRDELQRRIAEGLPQTVVNGDPKRRLPNSLHLSWPNIDGERLVMLLDESGVQAATGSACAANKQAESQVLRAICLEPSLIQGSLRLSLGAPTTMAEIARAADIIIESVKKLQ